MVLATMFTQKTTQSADLHRSREASRPGSIRLLTLINPIFGHFDPRKRRPFPSDTRQPPSRISSNLIQLRLRNPHNTKKKTPRLCVSASKRHSPSRPLNHEMPNDPSPISGHSPTTRQTKSATHPRDSVELYLPCKLLYTRSIRFVSGEVSEVMVSAIGQTPVESRIIPS
jgi:hypothetical protein